MNLWAQSEIYFTEWAIPSFYYLSTEPFMKPLLNEAACHALLSPAIAWGTAQQRKDIMECVMRGTYGLQYAFYNLIRRLPNHKEVSKYFKLWYGESDAIINDWWGRYRDVAPMRNCVVFTGYDDSFHCTLSVYHSVCVVAIEYFMRMREDNRNNFMCIVDLVDAAKMKIDRYKMNKTLDAEVSYFSDATFRALMDIVYDEMRRVWLREKRKQELGNFDCRKYVQIAKRFRRYMTELGFIDNKSRTVSRKTQKINGFCNKRFDDTCRRCHNSRCL